MITGAGHDAYDGAAPRPYYVHNIRTQRPAWHKCTYSELRCWLVFMRHLAMGCADPVTPIGTWLERTDDHAVVRCNSTQEHWYLTCNNGVWAGVLHNCSTVTFEGDHLFYLSASFGRAWCSKIIKHAGKVKQNFNILIREQQRWHSQDSIVGAYGEGSYPQ